MPNEFSSSLGKDKAGDECKRPHRVLKKLNILYAETALRDRSVHFCFYSAQRVLRTRGLAEQKKKSESSGNVKVDSRRRETPFVRVCLVYKG